MRYDLECIEICSSTDIEHANNFDGFRVFIVMFFSGIDFDPKKRRSTQDVADTAFTFPFTMIGAPKLFCNEADVRRVSKVVKFTLANLPF